jgi:hypothetical protein
VAVLPDVVVGMVSNDEPSLDDHTMIGLATWPVNARFTVTGVANVSPAGPNW